MTEVKEPRYIMRFRDDTRKVVGRAEMNRILTERKDVFSVDPLPCDKGIHKPKQLGNDPNHKCCVLCGETWLEIEATDEQLAP